MQIPVLSAPAIEKSTCQSVAAHHDPADLGALLDEPEDEDVAVEAINVDGSDEDSEPKHQKSTKKVCS